MNITAIQAFNQVNIDKISKSRFSQIKSDVSLKNGPQPFTYLLKSHSCEIKYITVSFFKKNAICTNCWERLSIEKIIQKAKTHQDDITGDYVGSIITYAYTD